MTRDELAEAVAYELDALRLIVEELDALKEELRAREPTMREKTAAGAFLAQFYMGVENVLKRISRYYGIPLPKGETWHLELFERFCVPASPPLPEIFDAALASKLGPYRRFRHVMHHGYGFHLEWERMEEGIGGIASIFTRFEACVEDFVDQLER